jgi:lia operon protein LiaG
MLDLSNPLNPGTLPLRRATRPATTEPAMRNALPALATLLLPLALGAQERQVLTGPTATIYNLAGAVRLEAGTGSDVVVEVRRGGRDAEKLEVRLRGGELVVRYPDDRIVYADADNDNGWGRWSSSTDLRVREDGTFGGDYDSDRGRRTEIRSRGDGLEAHADLTVRVPNGKRVQLHLAVGRVEITNVQGDLDIDVHSASVNATGTKGRLLVDAGSGSVRVENATGELNVDTGSGSTTLTSVDMTSVSVDAGSGSVEARGVKAGRFLVDVGSGGVRAEGLTTDELSIDTGSGSVRVELTKVPSRSNVDTGSGGVTLVLPEAAKADLDIDTGSGGISSAFAVTADSFERRELRGRINGGGPLIRISTGSGGVRLQKF